MWLFDKQAFTSTVAYDPTKDFVKDSKHKEVALASEDPSGMWLLVRARVKEDLVVMEKTLQTVKNDPAFSVYVATDTGADYSFRALVCREDWKLYLCALVDDIDYGSHFKEVVKANASQPNERYTAMMKVWSAMSNLQPFTPYGGYTGGSWNYAGGGWAKSTLSVAKDFVPSTKWITAQEARQLLTEAPASAWADDTIEAMDDAAFELYLAASKLAAVNGNADTPMTEEEVDDLIDSLDYEEVGAGSQD
jgi:hypothetical protein